jgi:hypothetical protein
MVLAWRCGLTDRNGTFQSEFGDPGLLLKLPRAQASIALLTAEHP